MPRWDLHHPLLLFTIMCICYSLHASSAHTHSGLGKHHRHAKNIKHYNGTIPSPVNASMLPRKDMINTSQASTLPAQVKELAKAIMQLSLKKEHLIDVRIDDHIKFIRKSRRAFGVLPQKWGGAELTVQRFLQDVSIALDETRLASGLVTLWMTRISRFATGSGQEAVNSTEVDKPYDAKASGRSAIALVTTEANKKRTHYNDHARAINQNHAHTYTSAHHHRNSRRIVREVGNSTVSKMSGTNKCHQMRAANQTWWAPFHTVFRGIDAATKWFTFLQELERTLRTLDVQLNVLAGSLGDFSGWSGSNSITSRNVNEALQRMHQEYQLRSLEEGIPKLVSSATAPRLQYLNEVVNVSLKLRAKCSYNSTDLRVHSPFIFMSEVLACFKCETTETKTVSIVASGRLFIDTDLRSASINCGQTFDLTILAADLVVIGKQRVLDISSGTSEGAVFSLAQKHSGGVLLIKSVGEGDPKRFVPVILQFKSYTREVGNLFSRPVIRNMTETLDRNGTLQNLHLTTHLVQELTDLEKQIPRLSRRISLLYYYNSLAKRSRSLMDQAKPEDSRVLLFLHYTILAAKLWIQHPYEQIPAEDIEPFITAELENFKKIERGSTEPQRFQYLQEVEADYKNRTESRLADVSQFFETGFIERFNVTELYLKNVTQRILMEIEQLKNSSNQELDEKRQVLRSHILAGFIQHLIKTSAEVISFLSTVAGAVASGSANVSKAIVSNQTAAAPVDVPHHVSQANKRSALRFHESNARNFRGFLAQLETIKGILSSHGGSFQTIIQQTTELIEIAKEIAERPIGDLGNFAPRANYRTFKQKLLGEGYIRDVQRNLSNLLNGSGMQTSDADSPEMARIVAKRILMLPVEVVTYINSLTHSSWKEVADQVGNLECQLVHIKDQERKIQEEMIPDLDGLFTELGSTVETLWEQMLIPFDSIHWRVESAIRDIQVALREPYPKGSGVGAYFNSQLGKLGETMGTLHLHYRKLQVYIDRSEIINFTAAVHQDPTNLLAPLTDKELENKIQLLRYELQVYIVRKRAALVASSYRYWRFPIVEPKLCALAQIFKPEFESNSTIFIFLNYARSGFSSVVQDYKLYISTVSPGDQYIFHIQYGHGSPLGPLFTWHNVTHSVLIRSLLQGETIQVYSSLPVVPYFCNAHKLNRPELKFTSPVNDKAAEEEMRKLLEDYAVTLTHHGSSFFDFNQEIYQIEGNSLSAEFSFKLQNFEPVQSNEIYKKLAKGTLAPASNAAWFIKIMPLKPSSGYGPLIEKANLFDLHLQGSATCISLKFPNELPHVKPDCSNYNR